MPTHTIAENLTRLQNATTAIANAITTAGGTVNSGDGLEDFATDIGTIPGGSTEILAIEASSSVTIPAGVTGIADQGFKNSSVVTITFPNSLTTIGDEAFYGCTHLIGPLNFHNTGLTTIGDYAFYHSQVSLNPEDPEADQFIWPYPFPITTIGDHAFDGSNITRFPLDGNNTLVTIGDYAFYNTDLSVAEVYGSFIGTGVTTIGEHAFDGATLGLNPGSDQLFSLNGSLTTIGDYAFRYCIALGSGFNTVEIPSSVTTIGAHAFDGCTDITSIVVHKASGSITGAPWGATNATVTWTG